ncbi:10082_t:CDS:2, partial [Cetraspora pellucida]
SNIDMTMLTCFLEYYLNNAMDNIGWMNVVSEIIPLLYEKNLDWYAQEFLYRPCFGNKMLDLSSFKFHEIKKNSENSLKVYIPITQLIPRDTDLVLKDISDDEIPYIRMVPFIDFATNKKTLDPMDYVEKAITNLFLPGKYSSFETKNYSPFIRLLIKMDLDNAFYDNPSMEAVMNLVWYSSKSHWNRTLQIYLLYLLSYSIISWAYITNLEVQQFMFYGKKYVVDYFNWMDNIATFLPTILSFYFLLDNFNIGNGFKNATSTQAIVSIIFMSIIFLCDAFEAAKEKSKRVVLQLQTNLLKDYAMLEGSYITSKTNVFDYKFKDKLNLKYICFLDEPSLTKTWNEISHESTSRLAEYGFIARKQDMELNIDTDED